jgi:sec-independent protein translocase protein TatA
MPSLGAPELIIILVIILLIFGAGKLPQVFKQLGSSVKEFRDASTDTKSEAEAAPGATASAPAASSQPADTTKVDETADTAAKQ